MAKALYPNVFKDVGHSRRKEVKGMNDEQKLCPILAIGRAENEREDHAVCIKGRCAWWLPEYSLRVPRAEVGGRCALSVLAFQVWNIADK